MTHPRRTDVGRVTSALIVVLCAACGPTGAGDSESASASGSSGTSTSTTTIEAATTTTGDAWPACTPRVLDGRGGWTVRDAKWVLPEGLDCMVTELNAQASGLTLDCLVNEASTSLSIDLGIALPELSSLVGEALVLLLATEPDVINPQQGFVLRDAAARLRLAGFRGYAPQQAEGALLAPVALVALDGICEPPGEVKWGNSWRGAVDATLAAETVQIVDGDHAILHGPDGDYHVLAPLVEHGTQGLDDTSPKINVLVVGPSN